MLMNYIHIKFYSSALMVY